MKIYKNKNVFEAALDRIRLIFDEFDEVVVSISGGKDSTVIYELARIVAKERGKLPLKVMWIDQEAEWQQTVDTVKKVMYDKDVVPMWFQMPLKMLNATSTKQAWLNCWGDGEKWLREKDPIAIKENKYGTDRFKELFPAIAKVEFKGKKVAFLAGVRAEESPSRHIALTATPKYKWVTWCRVLSKKEPQVTFYPLYDWSYTDIWAAIEKHRWEYNPVYDFQYRYGVKLKDMRVSNLHHETAVHSLFHLQELDGKLYQDLTQRIAVIDTAGKLGTADYFIRELPFMFKTWNEYRDYLMEKIVEDPAWFKRLDSARKEFDALFHDRPDLQINASKVIINSIVCNDIELTKVDNYKVAFVGLYRRDVLRQKTKKEAKTN
jgi:predicted phosphoadenosine phosphosulfate sulfurtransferase